MPHVYSTLASDTTYTHWESPGEGIPPIEKAAIHIKGGASVAQKAKPGADIWTPYGFATEVSDTDMAYLERNEVFKLHQKNGFIRVDKKSMDVEKAVVDMRRRDFSSPMTESDYPAASGITVSTDVPKSTLRPGA